MEVSLYEFKQEICKDYDIESHEEIKTYLNDYEVFNGKRKINSSHDAVIVDKQGNKYPYMKTHNMRNDEKLEDFDYIYVIRSKSLPQICAEANIILKNQRCKICEGNGWYSYGRRYFYKDITCEI